MATDDALEILWLEERDRLVRACTLICGSSADAADAVDEAFVNTLARHRRTDIENLRGYLWRAAINEVNRSGRRGRRRRDLEEAGRSGSQVHQLDDTGSVEAALTAVSALAVLDPTSRAVLVLRFYADQSVASVAAHLGRSEGAIKTITRRALERVRQATSAETTPLSTPGGIDDH